MLPLTITLSHVGVLVQEFFAQYSESDRLLPRDIEEVFYCTGLAGRKVLSAQTTGHSII